MNRPFLPPPADVGQRPAVLISQLRLLIGEQAAALACGALLDGADPFAYADLLPYLAGPPAEGVLGGTWDVYWARVWGARGLRYVWHDTLWSSVVTGLSDESWRVAEMCTKVAGQRELGQAGDGVAALANHELSRVRAAAVRALGVIGDTEHVDVVRAALDDRDPTVRRYAETALEQLIVRLDLID